MRTLVSSLLMAGLLSGQAAAPPPVASGNAAIPLAEYNRLMDQAAQAPKRIEPPPRPYWLQSAEFKLRVEKESVVGSLQVLGEVLQKGPVRVALASGLMVMDAQQNGKPLPLAQNAGAYSALLEGPAEFDVRLECGLPLTAEAGRAGFTIPAVPAGTIRLALTLPGEQASVSMSPGLITERTSGGGRTFIQAILVPGKVTSVWWGARLASPAPTAPAKDLRFLSDVKSMVSVTEGEIALTVLSDITVVQGQASQFELSTPDGYEVTNVAGATLAESDASPGKLVLRLNNPAARSHQFLIAMARPNTANKAEIVLPGFAGTQRETGEVLVEGQGALELAAQEKGGLRRMDLREASPPLRALADHSVQAAFRYQKRTTAGTGTAPGVALEWVRFPSAPLLSALSDQAVATTLVNREGRSLTEVRLTVRNQSRSFVRIGLPAGATILTAEVAGEKVKPVEASDGSRVPLQRAGFRPTGAYVVSFVFAHAGAPFGKRGAAGIALPKMDLPIGAIEWEVMLPPEFRVSGFGGDALEERLLGRSGDNEPEPAPSSFVLGPARPGEVGGTVLDPSGASIPRARIVVTHATGQRFETTSNPEGVWRVPFVPAGRIEISVEAQGFRRLVRPFDHQAGQPLSVTLTLELGSVSQSIEVSTSLQGALKESQQAERLRRQEAGSAQNAASANAIGLQRLAGVLPIAVSVPRTGSSYRFVRPLVVDEETKLTFQYRAGK